MATSRVSVVAFERLRPAGLRGLSAVVGGAAVCAGLLVGTVGCESDGSPQAYPPPQQQPPPQQVPPGGYQPAPGYPPAPGYQPPGYQQPGPQPPAGYQPAPPGYQVPPGYQPAPGYGGGYQPVPPRYGAPGELEYSRDPRTIPERAGVVARGDRGARIAYRADADGVVWVVDRDKREIVVVRRVERGDTVEVQPGDDRVLLNGRKIFDQNMEGKHSHVVHFLPEGRRRGDDRPERLPDELDGAQRVAFGSGGDISFTAREAGRVIVYDSTDRKVVHQVDVRRGDGVTLRPRKDEFRLSGKPHKLDLKSDHDYELYYRR